jgi:Flavodoxin reductases (ferredoxin-NADPH reductases) family 1
MAEKHVVRFEPVGIEIEVSENQNILRAAQEQGVMLMHGCKEGQCASCKSFVLDGDEIELDKYSTFALPDFELEEGYTLLCRAHAYEDLTIELLNYDEEMIRSGLPIQEAVTEVVSKDAVTHDMRHLVLRLIEPTEIKFFPGQYVDITIPDTGAVRSFSMANTSSRESGLLEFVIKVYHDGLFSKYLAERMAEGDRLEITGPFGVFTLREGDNDWCSSAAARAWRPSCRCYGPWPSAVCSARPPSSTAPGPRRTSASSPNCTGWSRSCRASVTYRPCPSRLTTRNGTARPA